MVPRCCWAPRLTEAGAWAPLPLTLLCLLLNQAQGPLPPGSHCTPPKASNHQGPPPHHLPDLSCPPPLPLQQLRLHPLRPLLPWVQLPLLLLSLTQLRLPLTPLHSLQPPELVVEARQQLLLQQRLSRRNCQPTWSGTASARSTAPPACASG